MSKFNTTVTKTVEVPAALYVRPSAKNSDTIVIGVEAGDERKRVALVRLNADGTVKVRTLDGNAREASSNCKTQTCITLSLSDLTDDSE